MRDPDISPSLAPGRTAETRSDGVVYKVLRASEAELLIASARFEGSADDRRDGFIHLSTRDQLAGTLERHFAGEDRLFLSFSPVDRLGSELRFEPSRGGALFPHLYRPLVIADVAALVPIPERREGWLPPTLNIIR